MANYRTADYTQTVLSVSDIDAAMQLPWTAYQVDLAVAERDWWLDSEKANFLNLTAQLNAADTQYHQSVGAARLAWSSQSSSAERAFDESVAGLLHSWRSATLNARVVYAHATFAAEETWQQDRLAAARDEAVSTKAAYRQWVDDEDDQAHTAALAAAATLRAGAERTTDLAYSVSEANADGVRRTTEADDWRDYVASWHVQELGYLTLQTSADVAYSSAESAAEAVRQIAVAEALADYEVASTASRADALADLALTNDTPWAAYDAAFAETEADYTALVAPAEAALAAAVANANKDFEISVVTAAAANVLAEAQHEQTRASSAADAEYDWAVAQSAAESARAAVIPLGAFQVAFTAPGAIGAGAVADRARPSLPNQVVEPLQAALPIQLQWAINWLRLQFPEHFTDFQWPGWPGSDTGKVHNPAQIANGGQPDPRVPATIGFLDRTLSGDPKRVSDEFWKAVETLGKWYGVSPEELGDFAYGFVMGFFIDGMGGSLETLGILIKLGIENNIAVKLYRAGQFINQLSTGKGDPEKRERLENLYKMLAIAGQVAEQLGAKASAEIQEHLQIILTGSPEELEALADKDKQYAAFVLQLMADLAGILADLPAETKGRILGAILYEISEDAALAFLTKGAGNAVMAGKFVKLLDKLEDLPAALKKLKLPEEIVNELKKLFAANGKYAQLFAKFEQIDDAADATSVAKLTKGGCFVATTLVARFVARGADELIEDAMTVLPETSANRYLVGSLLVGAGIAVGGWSLVRRRRRAQSSTGYLAETQDDTLTESFVDQLLFHYYALPR